MFPSAGAPPIIVAGIKKCRKVSCLPAGKLIDDSSADNRIKRLHTTWKVND
jgi:hypothetical protein